MQQSLNNYLINLTVEKRENPKIFELQKTQCGGFFRGKNGFIKPFLPLKLPLFQKGSYF
ncbi:MAG: hypothetical protein ACI9XO_004523 [Paraglaciecola sp.]|jgi:hypothetical protein